jgi:hypothetical protein
MSNGRMKGFSSSKVLAAFEYFRDPAGEEGLIPAAALKESFAKHLPNNKDTREQLAELFDHVSLGSGAVCSAAAGRALTIRARARSCPPTSAGGSTFAPLWARRCRTTQKKPTRRPRAARAERDRWPTAKKKREETQAACDSQIRFSSFSATGQTRSM